MDPAAVLSVLVKADGIDDTNRKLHTVSGNLEKTGGIGQKMGAALAKGAKIGAAGVAAGTVIAVKSASEFESTFAEVRKTVDANERQYAKLEKGIRKMSKTIPIGTSELNNLAGQAGALGVARKDLLAFTKTAAELGIATDMSSEDAMNSLARLSNIMGTASKDTRRLASTFVQLGNDGASTESEIANMSLRIAATGRQVGLNEPQILSFASALASVGINAEAGGSSISNAFMMMAQAVDKGGDKLRTYAKTADMSQQAFARLFDKNAAMAMIRFMEGLDRIRKSGESVFPVLEDLDITQIRMRQSLLSAASAGDLFRYQLKVGSDEWRRNNALTREAEQRYNTLESMFTVLKNNLNDVAISLGQRLMPALKDVLKILNNPKLTIDEKFRAVFELIMGYATDAFEFVVEKAAHYGPIVALEFIKGFARVWQDLSIWGRLVTSAFLLKILWGPLRKAFMLVTILKIIGGKKKLRNIGLLIGELIGAGIVAGTAGQMAAGAGAGVLATGLAKRGSGAAAGAAMNAARTGAGGAASAAGTAASAAAAGAAGGAAAARAAARETARAASRGATATTGALTSSMKRSWVPAATNAGRAAGAGAGAAAGKVMVPVMKKIGLAVAKRVGLIGVGIALADGVISEFGRQVQLRSDDLFESLEARAKGFQGLNTLTFGLPKMLGADLKITGGGGKEAGEIVEVMNRLREGRTQLNTLDWNRVQNAAVILDIEGKLTEEHKKQIGQLNQLISASKELEIGVDAKMDPAQMALLERNVEMIKKGYITRIGDVRKMVERNMAIISNEMGSKTVDGRKAVAQNLRLLADAMQNNMRKTGNETKKGMDRVERILREADLITATKGKAQEFAREWAKGIREAGQITDRGTKRIIREMKMMPVPMRQVAFDTFWPILKEAAKAKKIPPKDIADMRSDILTSVRTLTAETRTESRGFANTITGNSARAARGHSQALGAMVTNHNQVARLWDAEVLRYQPKKLQTQDRQKGGFIVPGVGSGDKFNTALPAGSYVLNRNATAAYGFNAGGMVPVALEPGERVFSPGEARRMGYGALEAMNGAVKRFQAGGGVGIPKGGFPDAMGALPGLDALAYILNRRFGLSVTSGHRPGAWTTSGNPSDHGWGGAIDVSNGITTPQMDAAHAWLQAKMGPAIKQMLYRTMVGGDHFNHIHIALLESFANNAAAVMALAGGDMFGSVAKPKIEGPGDLMQDLMEGSIDQIHKGLNKHLDSIMPKFSAGAGTGGFDSVAGNWGKGQIMQLWNSQGGNQGSANLAAAIALGESGGNPNAINHNTNGTIDRGLWQINSIHGALSTLDPAGNARAAVQISGNGSDWTPWVVYNRGLYQQYLAEGGLVDLLQKGGKAKQAEVWKHLPKLPRASTTSKAGKRYMKKVLKKIQGFGLSDDMTGRLGKMADEAFMYNEYANAAGGLNETDRDGNTTYGKFAGHDQEHWLKLELEALLGLRNQLIHAHRMAENRLKMNDRAIARARKQLEHANQKLKEWKRKRLVAEKKIKIAERELKKKTEVLREARSAHEKLVTESKRDLPFSKQARRRAAGKRAEAAGQVPASAEALKKAREAVVAQRDKLQRFQGDLGFSRASERHWTAESKAFKRGLDTLVDAKGRMTSTASDIAGSGGDIKGKTIPGLVQVQGTGRSMSIMTSEPALGELGGDILAAQSALRSISQEKLNRVDPGQSDSMKADLYKELYESERRARVISERQYEVIRGLPMTAPFMGGFAAGGIAMVGEQGGAELTHMSSGSRIYSASDTRRMLKEGNQVNLKVVMYEDGSVEVIDEDLNKKIDAAIEKKLRRSGRGVGSTPGRGGVFSR